MRQTPILKVKIPPLCGRGLGGQFKSVSQDVNLVIEVVKNALRPVVHDELKKEIFNIEFRGGFLEIFLSEKIARETLFDNSISEVLLATFREIQQAFNQYKEIKNNCVELLLVDNSVDLERANTICFRSKAAKDFVERYLQSPFDRDKTLSITIDKKNITLTFPTFEASQITERKKIQLEPILLNTNMKLKAKITGVQHFVSTQLNPDHFDTMTQIFARRITCIEAEADVTISRSTFNEQITAITLISISPDEECKE
ncbi:MAG: hypothetical protein ABNH02_01090 [Pseudomonadales bacterium]|jgi:hypothetical protein